MPAKITTPDAVETRIGTLRFRDGAPDLATVQLAYDQLDFGRGSTPSFEECRPPRSTRWRRGADRGLFQDAWEARYQEPMAPIILSADSACSSVSSPTRREARIDCLGDPTSTPSCSYR